MLDSDSIFALILWLLCSNLEAFGLVCGGQYRRSSVERGVKLVAAVSATF